MATETDQGERALGKAYDARLIARLATFARPHWLLVVLGLALIPLPIAFELCQPYLLKIAIDDHIAVRELSGLAPILMLFAGAIVLQGISSLGQLYVFQLVGQRSMHGLRTAIYSHVMSQRRAFFDSRPVGRLLTRMTNDVETINEIFTMGVITLLADMIKMIAIVIMMFALDVKLTLITFLTLPALVVLVVWARGVMRTSFRQIRVKLAAMNAFISEHISGIKVVQLFRRQEEAAENYDRLNAGHRDAYLSAIRADAAMYAVVEAIGVTAAAAIAWYSGAHIGKAGLTVGLVIAFIEYINKFFIPVRDLSAKYTVMQSAMAASERIVELLDTKEPDAPVFESSDSAETSDGPSVEFHGVHFGYRDGQEVLSGIDVAVQQGQTVAVVGATGSGKSTLIRLLARLYEPQSGSIKLNGVDIRRLPADELRKRLTVVSQDVFLFSGTIAENVRLGRPDATDDEVRAALRTVGAHQILERRNVTIHDEVAERGQNFSSGERQLISFARALIRDPEVLILDEATAHVDPEAEELIETGLATLMKGRTSLVIAHRLSTIRGADSIIVLSKGRVAESGSHDELVAAGGMYARLEQSFRQQ